MQKVFADTSYWIALINPRDNLHQRAKDVSSQLLDWRMVTSDMVLTEVLNAFANYGAQARETASAHVNSIMSHASVEVVPQTRALFRRALALYAERRDKEWSLTDCASFIIMTQQHMTEALTHDHHFEQKAAAA
jgi:predicted nucleic acid-binding protein